MRQGRTTLTTLFDSHLVGRNLTHPGFLPSGICFTMPHPENPSMPVTALTPRLTAIALARKHVLDGQPGAPGAALSHWIERSWQRCLAAGLRPDSQLEFELCSPKLASHTQESNAQLVNVASSTMHHLARAIVNTRYFVILTNAQGVVVDAQGAIDHSDPRAHLITRVGTDLSEMRMGTTAIGATLAELQPVWLHRGEHFFDATSAYSCAGAPIFAPNGACAGMLDVTGVDTQERPELTHLVTQSARKIENALVLNQRHALLLRLNWPGNAMGSDADGLLSADADGWVLGANPVGRQLVPGSTALGQQPVHASELFGLPFGQLFDAAKWPDKLLELPLWSGLRLQAQVIASGSQAKVVTAGSTSALPLKDVEAAMIRKALDEARGNVGQAARALGISRATLYRKLGHKSS
jgi:transcriptional regulator of acetoin/glycerol metabolism